MKAIIYCRVSTTDQAEEGYSLDTQERDCRNYAERHNLEVVTVFKEDYTGTEINRPKLREVRRLLASGKAGALIVYTSSRLSRVASHSLLLAEEIWSAGGELHFTDTGKVENTPEGLVQLGIGALFAGYQRAKFLETANRNKRTKAEGGRIPGSGPAPYGYRYKGTGKDKELVIYEPEAEIIRKVFTWYVLGDEHGLPLTTGEISRRLTLAGVPLPEHMSHTRDNRGVIHTATIWRWLRSEVYAGVFWAYKLKSVSKTKAVKRDPSERVGIPVTEIVDRELWESAQQRLAAQKTESSRNSQAPFLLRVRIRCSCGYAVGCHSAIHKGRKGDRNYLMMSYTCLGRNTRRGYKECPFKGYNWPTREIDKAVWNWIEGILLTPDAIRESFRRLEAEKETTLAELQRERVDQATNLERVGKQLTKLLKLYLAADDDDEYTKRLYDQERKPLEELRHNLEASISELDSRIHTATASEEDLEVLLKFSEQVQSRLGSYEFEQRRHLVELLDVRATLTVESGKRVVYLTSRVSSGRLIVEGRPRKRGNAQGRL